MDFEVAVPVVDKYNDLIGQPDFCVSLERNGDVLLTRIDVLPARIPSAHISNRDKRRFSNVYFRDDDMIPRRLIHDADSLT